MRLTSANLDIGVAQVAPVGNDRLHCGNVPSVGFGNTYRVAPVGNDRLHCGTNGQIPPRDARPVAPVGNDRLHCGEVMENERGSRH